MLNLDKVKNLVDAQTLNIINKLANSGDTTKLKKWLASAEEHYKFVGQHVSYANALYHEIEYIKYLLEIKENNMVQEGSDTSRIAQMVASWKKEGIAFSRIDNDDSTFFKAIKTPYDKLGITSQTGMDVVYYDTNLYDSDTNALRRSRKIAENRRNLKGKTMLTKKEKQLVKEYATKLVESKNRLTEETLPQKVRFTVTEGFKQIKEMMAILEHLVKQRDTPIDEFWTNYDNVLSMMRKKLDQMDKLITPSK